MFKSKLNSCLSILIIATLMVLAYVVYDRTQEDIILPEESEGEDYIATESFGGIATPDVTNSAVADRAQQAKSAVENFMNARLERDYTQAKPYMTDNLANNLNQDKFSGTSSPSMDSYEINSLKENSKAGSFVVTVKTHWLLSGDDAGTVIYNMVVKKTGSKYLIDQFDEAKTDWK